MYKRSAPICALILAVCLLSGCTSDASVPPSVSVVFETSTTPSEPPLPSNNATISPSELLHSPSASNRPAIDLTNEPPLSEYQQTMPVPDFLDTELQTLYRKASNLYVGPFGFMSMDIEYATFEEQTLSQYESVNVNGYEYLKAHGRYKHWEDFFIVTHSIFTDEYFNDLNTISDGMDRFAEKDGNLCVLDVANGSSPHRNENFPDEFALLERTDTTISFTVKGFYSYGYPHEGESFEERDARLKAGYESTEEFPIEMIMTDGGWRFSKFADTVLDMSYIG